MMQPSINRSRMVQLSEFAEKIHVPFRSFELLDQALTHTSYAHEHNHLKHNERLEFLGDAVLELAISQHIYHLFPSAPEGNLTRYRASVVCEASLARVANNLGLGHYLLLGKGEEMTGGRNRPSLLADAVEAVIGAVYLEQGLEQVSAFIIKQLEIVMPNASDGQLQWDYKTHLQELIQKTTKQKLDYEIIAETGPDHDKLFTAVVRIDRTELGKGQGRTKKEAEQAAAEYAFTHLSSN